MVLGHYLVLAAAFAVGEADVQEMVFFSPTPSGFTMSRCSCDNQCLAVLGQPETDGNTSVIENN